MIHDGRLNYVYNWLGELQHDASVIFTSSSVGRTGRAYWGAYAVSKFAVEGLSASLRQELSPFGIDVVVLRPEAIDTKWRSIAGATLLANSADGPYKTAVRAMHAKYTSPEFDNAVADPKVVADTVEKILHAARPKSVYMTPFMANVLLTVVKLMSSDRVRDAFVRKFIGLPKTM